MWASRISVLGAGAVGTAIAFSLVVEPLVEEVLLVDSREELRDAQVEDLKDASLSGVQIRAGTYKEASESSIVIITSGYRQKPGEPRTALLSKNLKILRQSIEAMRPLHKDTIIVVVTNPVDVLTFFAQQMSGLPRNQVIGSGTFLDSKRLKGVLSCKLNVCPAKIEGFVIGEHGETQVVAWSSVTIERIALREVLASRKMKFDYKAVAAEVKNKADVMISAKGSTSFGIGALTVRLCKSIIHDEKVIQAVSCWNEELKCCLSLPFVLGRKGVIREVSMVLTADESWSLERSAGTLRSLIAAATQNEFYKQQEIRVIINQVESAATAAEIPCI